MILVMLLVSNKQVWLCIFYCRPWQKVHINWTFYIQKLFFRNEDKIFSSASSLAENCTSIEKSFNPDVGSVEDGAAAIGTVAHASVTVTIAGTGTVDSISITLGSVIFKAALAAFKTFLRVSE